MRYAAICLILASNCLFAAPIKKCDELAATIPFGSDVKVESAKLVAATGALPEHCDIRGVIWPEARFAVKLPSNWNNRFEMVGNGGWAGTISLAAMDTGVRDGYATSSTDTGHDAQKEPGASFAYRSATNPNASRKVIDFGYLAVHETALLAKKMIRAYYGADPAYSYWVGCSTGGREGLMEAQRYPEDFDGYVIGAPVLFLTGLQSKSVWNYQVAGTGPGAIKGAKVAAISKAFYEKCDALDGLKDGLVENPLKCDFDPARDLPKCEGDTDGAECFTKAQIAALKQVYAGPRTAAGKQLFPGMPPGGDGGINAGFQLADSFAKFMAFDPAPGTTWDFHTFNIESDLARMSSLATRIDATIPDLTAVKMRGGKIVHYHGWADPGVSPKMSIEYYDSVVKTVGEKETADFYRFFPVPGMFHCQGGPGCGEVDWLSAVVNWVEKGTAPTMLVGAHVEKGETKRTRPICAWPNTAHYKGSGSIDAAENFACGASL